MPPKHWLSPTLVFLLVAAGELPATAPPTRPVDERRVLEFVPEATPDAQAPSPPAARFPIIRSFRKSPTGLGFRR
jgi:hypothetical protein